MHAVHLFGRLTKYRSLPTQLSSRRYSAVGGFNAPRVAAFARQESSGEPVMNFYQTTLTASIAAFLVRRVEGQ